MKWFKLIGVGLFLLVLWFSTYQIVHISPNVSVIEVSGEQTVYMAPEWIEPSDELVFGSHDWIADGIIRNMRTVEIKYRFMDADITDYSTLVDFEISEVVYSEHEKEYKPGQVVTVMLPFSTRQGAYLPGSELPILQKGTKALLFGTDPAALKEDTLECAEYADIRCGAANYVLIEKKYGYYLADAYFEDALKSDAVKNVTDKAIASDGSFGWVEACIRRRRFGDDPLHHFDDPGWSNNYCVCDEAAFKQLIAQKAAAYRSENSL